MSKNKTLEVSCPHCESVLTVDAQSGEVLLHQEPPKKGPVLDLDEAKKDLAQGAGRRKKLFEESIQSEKKKGDRLRRQFEEALKKAKEDPDEAPSVRDVDL